MGTLTTSFEVIVSYDEAGTTHLALTDVKERLLDTLQRGLLNGELDTEEAQSYEVKVHQISKTPTKNRFNDLLEEISKGNQEIKAALIHCLSRSNIRGQSSSVASIGRILSNDDRWDELLKLYQER